MQATELVIKNKKFIDNSCQMYQKVFEDKANNGRNLKTFLFQVHQVLVNQDLQDLARRINIINGKSINSIYTAPTAKDGKTYDFIDSEYKAHVTPLTTSMQHHLTCEL